MFPSVLPRLTTDLAVRVFPAVWKLLSFLKLPSRDGARSLPLLSLFFCLLFFFLPFFEDNGLLFWVPDCSHEIKRRLLLGRKVMTNLDSILKSRDITLPTKVLVKAMVFPVVIYGCESWTVKKAEH